MTAIPTRLERVPALDGLRALAILGVLFVHAKVPHLLGGDVGVAVFFVLSGYLITTLLLAERSQTGRVDLKAFYTRRAVRLGPALVVALLSGCILTLYVVGPDGGKALLWGAGSALLYCSNFVMAAKATADAHMGIFSWGWSLSLEEQFYALWPAVLLICLARGGRRWLVLGTVSLAAASAAERFTMHMGAWNPRLYYAPDTRADAILTGCLLALLLDGRRAPKPRLLAQLGLGLILLVYIHGAILGDWTYHWGLVLVELGSAALIASLVQDSSTTASRALGSAPFTWLGRRSYAVYLWNSMLLQLMQFAGGTWMPPTPRGWILWISLTLLAAELSFWLVERPVTRMARTRYRPMQPAAAG